MDIGKIKVIIISIVSLIISFYCGYLYNGYLHNKENVVYTTPDDDDDDDTKEDVPPFSDETTVTIKDKETPEDPDVIVDNKYIAKIDGVTYEIPKVQNGSGKVTDKTVQVTNKIDMTPVVDKLGEVKYDRNWSIGVGMGLNRTDDSVYVPVSIERHFNYDRSVEGVFGIDKDGHVENVALLYKVHF